MFVGLLGGSFNPIHNGHLHIANQVYEILHLDRIMFIPTGDPPHKPTGSLAPAHHRLEMVKLAIVPFSHFTVSDRETWTPEVSYSVDTITELKASYPNGTQLGFIVGLDAFLDFPSWKHAGHLLELCHFIVCSRPGVAFAQLDALPLFPRTAPSSALQSLDQLSITRLDVPLPSGTTIILLSVPPCEISASTIRERRAQNAPISNWLPANVESYIIQHQLYQ
jgi:nicotinate-nucleotide adenylyltransferase